MEKHLKKFVKHCFPTRSLNYSLLLTLAIFFPPAFQLAYRTLKCDPTFMLNIPNLQLFKNYTSKYSNTREVEPIIQLEGFLYLKKC